MLNTAATTAAQGLFDRPSVPIALILFFSASVILPVHPLQLILLFQTQRAAS